MSTCQGQALALGLRNNKEMCGESGLLLDMVGSRWRLQPPGYLMTHAGSGDDDALIPEGYRLDLVIGDRLAAARMIAADGSLAASGYAAEHEGAFILDRVVTEPAHRRLGLGRVLIARLLATQRSRASRRVLVATQAGRGLYEAAGWTVRSPYATVAIDA